MSVRDEIGSAKTAFVFAGGGSFGAVQVGMLHSLAAHGVAADMVVGSSVGALNGAFYAGDPTPDGVERLAAIWRGLQRHDVFPMNWRTLEGEESRQPSSKKRLPAVYQLRPLLTAPPCSNSAILRPKLPPLICSIVPG